MKVGFIGIGKLGKDAAEVMATHHFVEGYDVNKVFPSNFNMVELKQMLRETIEEVLTEKGLVVESTERTKEQISLRVGQHLFEGVLTKIKKMK
jgi:predicted dinucleotide-utilizing enzyme